jgi:hypothetical protein
MNFHPSEDQAIIAEAFSRFLDEHSSMARVFVNGDPRSMEDQRRILESAVDLYRPCFTPDVNPPGSAKRHLVVLRKVIGA